MSLPAHARRFLPACVAAVAAIALSSAAPDVASKPRGSMSPPPDSADLAWRWCASWFLAGLPEDRFTREIDDPVPSRSIERTHTPGDPFVGYSANLPGDMEPRTVRAEDGSATFLFHPGEPSDDDPLREFANSYGAPIFNLIFKPTAHKDDFKRWFDEVRGAMHGMYPPKVREKKRTAPFEVGGGVEHCIDLRFSPGHMTLKGGKHLPLPWEHSLIFARLTKPSGRFIAAFRIPEKGVSYWFRFLYERLPGGGLDPLGDL